MTNGLLRSWERRSHCQNNFGNADPWVQRVAKDVSVRSWSDNNEYNPALLSHFLIVAPSINVETSATYFLNANSECMWQFFQKSDNPSPLTKVNKTTKWWGPSSARVQKCVSLKLLNEFSYLLLQTLIKRIRRWKLTSIKGQCKHDIIWGHRPPWPDPIMTAGTMTLQWPHRRRSKLTSVAAF